jgi:tetratricopeptide (TPR) repeat protein
MLLRRAPEAAEKATAEALRLDPDNVQSLRIRATALFALERAEELLELAEPLERMAPGRGWGALARGAHHVLRKERALAAPWLASAEGDPETETLLTVAAAWLMIESPDEAERVFKRVLEIDPANASAETGMALAAMGRRDFVSADLALRRAAAQDPGRVAIYQTMAKVYHATGRKDFAARAEKMARRLGPPAELPG